MGRGDAARAAVGAAECDGRSALRRAESLNTPLLIMRGGADRGVSPGQSLALAQRLQALGKTYGLFIYPGDGHTLPRNREDRDRRAPLWFKSHLKKVT